MKIKLFCTETHPPPLSLSPRQSSHQTNLDRVFTKLTPVNAAKCPLPWTMAPRGQRSPALPPSSPTRENDLALFSQITRGISPQSPVICTSDFACALARPLTSDSICSRAPLDNFTRGDWATSSPPRNIQAAITSSQGYRISGVQEGGVRRRGFDAW
ncbi:hypothetical protein V8C44DRAFT_339690 [Trichoderma aethiopicum]